MTEKPLIFHLHPLNVPGDFYVEDGCCLTCQVPFTEAPGMFGEADGDSGHCYIKKQPTSEDEENQMIVAIQVADMGCIRYAGNNQRIIQQLVELKEGGQCDMLAGGKNNHVLTTPAQGRQSTSLFGLLSSFINRLRKR